MGTVEQNEDDFEAPAIAEEELDEVAGGAGGERRPQPSNPGGRARGPRG